MLINVIGENVFKVGEKVYKAGDNIDIEGMPPIDLKPFGTVVAKDLNDYLVQLNADIKARKQELMNRLHASDEEYNEETAQLAWDYDNMMRNFILLTDVFIKALEAHVGGALPMTRHGATGVVNVRAPKKDERLNFLRTLVSERIQFERWDGVRSFGLSLWSRDKTEVVLEQMLTLGFPCLCTDSVDTAPSITALEAAARDALAKLTLARYPVLVIWTKPDITLVMDFAEAYVRQNQRHPYTPQVLVGQLERLLPKIQKPSAISIVTAGEITSVQPGTMGIHIAKVEADKACHLTLQFDKGTTLKTASEGEFSKLPKPLEDIVQRILKGE